MQGVMVDVAPSHAPRNMEEILCYNGHCCCMLVPPVVSTAPTLPQIFGKLVLEGPIKAFYHAITLGMVWGCTGFLNLQQSTNLLY